MKQKLCVILLALTLALTLFPVSALAVTSDLNSYTPYNLTASLTTPDQTHPHGSTLLTFKIDNLLPSNTTEQWYAHIQKQIGVGAVWQTIHELDSNFLMRDHQTGTPGEFSVDHKWNEGYDWDGTTSISFRVQVTHYGSEVASEATPWSNVVTLGLEGIGERLSGADRIETAVAIAKAGWPNGANTVILTRDDNYPDALTGTPLSKKLDAPILFTNSKTLTAATKTEIARLKAGSIVILGGTGAVSQSIEDQLKQSYTVKRIGGTDRYDTAGKIAQELGNKGKAVITTGEDFHDALVVAPLAADKGFPILLTTKDSLPAATRSALAFVAPTEITLVGSTAAVSDKVAAELGNVKRVSGSDFYRTAVTVAKAFGANPTQVFLATGENFPDALAGSALAAKYNSPILFVGDPLVAEVQQYLKENKDITSKVNLLGGEGAISAKTKEAVDNIYK